MTLIQRLADHGTMLSIEAAGRLDYQDFVIDYLMEALGSANDDIMDMANEAWERDIVKRLNEENR